MNVLIIRPPYIDYGSTEPPRVGVPLGALGIAASIEQRGHTVRVFDALIYLNDTPDRTHVGASWERIEKEIRTFRPDIVGIVNLFSSQLENALRLPRLVRQVSPDVKIMVGGPHATVRPEDFLNTGFFDVAILGEGEIAGADVVDCYAGKKKFDDVRGIAYHAAGLLKLQPQEYIKDLDALPFPAYHLIDMEKYFQLVKRGLSSRPQDPFQRPRREITMSLYLHVLCYPPDDGI